MPNSTDYTHHDSSKIWRLVSFNQASNEYWFEEVDTNPNINTGKVIPSKHWKSLNPVNLVPIKENS